MKRTNIKVLEWNLNFGGYDSVEPSEFVGKYIKGFDVVILTEVRANRTLLNIIEMLGYDYICSEDQGIFSNQIIIATKKVYRLKKIRDNLNDCGAIRTPDFLHGIIEIGKKEVNIIGVRVKTSEYEQRFAQIKLMRNYLFSIEGSIICAGDFNSGQIRGLDDSDYANVKSMYQYCSGSNELSPLRYYNFHKIKNLISKKFVLRETFGEQNSWGLCEKEGRLVYGLGKRIKNDLLFYSEDLIGRSRYSWKHVHDNEQEYLNILVKNRRKRGNKVDYGYPDHARLLAEIAV